MIKSKIKELQLKIKSLRVTKPKNIITGFLIILVAFAADQITKIWIMNTYEIGERHAVEIIEDFLYISHVRNHGAAWSIFSGNAFMLVWLTGFVIICMLVFLLFNKNMALTVPVAMIVGGGLGNLYDRIFRDGVVDFIDVYLFSRTNGGYDFPVFNVADSILFCGTIALSIYVLFIMKEPEKEKEISECEEINE